MEINVKTKKTQTDLICPECQKGYLNKIDGKNGIFYGCNRFPNCRFTKDEEK